MKKTITILLANLIIALTAQAQEFGGKVLSDEGEGIPYAGIAIFAMADSSFVAVTLADADGNFRFENYYENTILVASSVGYSDTQVKAERGMSNIITMKPDHEMISAAVFTVELPKTRLENGAIVTRVKNSVLENAGSAADALAKIPGMMRMGDDLQVIGKGHPVYYINGRKVQDESELSRLLSSEIREVEVISNPGAAYSSQARAVVRIRTTQRTDEGLGGSVNISDIQTLRNGNNLLASNIKLDYRYKGLDVFIGGTYNMDYLHQYKYTLNQTTRTEQEFKLDGELNESARQARENINIGANYQFNDNHSAGIRFEKGFTSHRSWKTIMDNTAFVDGKLYEKVHSENNITGKDSGPSLLNGYYSGKIKKLSIEWDADWYSSSTRNLSDITENDQTGTSTYKSDNFSKNSLIASKATVSHPLWKGTISGGTQVNFIRRDNMYEIDNDRIRDSKSEAREDNVALFAEYSCFFPKAGILTAGLRYEFTSFRYDSVGKDDVKSNTSRFYPSVSFATEIKGLQMSLSYSIRTKKPTYNELRSGIAYASRFTLSTGNPKLKDEIIHGVNLSMRKGVFAFSADYQRRLNAIFDWTYPYDDNGTVLLSMTNFDKPLDVFDAYLVASPSVGIFTSVNVVGIQYQNISFNLDDPTTENGKRLVKYNKPMFIFNSSNYLRLKKGWQLELNSEFYSKAHFGNALLTNNYWDLSFAIQKSCLRDKNLTFRLSINDIFKTADFGALVDLGNYQLMQNPVNGQSRGPYEMHRITFSVKYTFNARKDRYNGKGAGREMIQRLYSGGTIVKEG